MEATIEYIVTKEQCQQDIDSKPPVVCPRCGGKIEPVETVDNSGNPTHWRACLSCDCLSYGVPVEVFMTAKTLFEKHGKIAFRHLKEPVKDKLDNYLQDYKYYKESQIGGLSSEVLTTLNVYNEITHKKK